MRERGILVTSCASTRRDSYCALAWGGKLAEVSDADLAAGVLRGEDAALTEPEQALAAWSRAVARDPNRVSAGDVQALRDAGYDDGQIVAITIFVALRMAFSAVNDALGAQPDPELVASLPEQVRDAVDFGRPPGPGPV